MPHCCTRLARALHWERKKKLGCSQNCYKNWIISTTFVRNRRKISNFRHWNILKPKGRDQCRHHNIWKFEKSFWYFHPRVSTANHLLTQVSGAWRGTNWYHSASMPEDLRISSLCFVFCWIEKIAEGQKIRAKHYLKHRHVSRTLWMSVC